MYTKKTYIRGASAILKNLSNFLLEFISWSTKKSPRNTNCLGVLLVQPFPMSSHMSRPHHRWFHVVNPWNPLPEPRLGTCRHRHHKSAPGRWNATTSSWPGSRFFFFFFRRCGVFQNLRMSRKIWCRDLETYLYDGLSKSTREALKLTPKVIPTRSHQELVNLVNPVTNWRLNLECDVFFTQKKHHPWKFNVAPENGWLEDEFPIGIPYFQGLS